MVYVNIFVSGEFSINLKASSRLLKSNTSFNRHMEQTEKTLDLITRTPWEYMSGAGHENL